MNVSRSYDMCWHVQMICKNMTWYMIGVNSHYFKYKRNVLCRYLSTCWQAIAQMVHRLGRHQVPLIASRILQLLNFIEWVSCSVPGRVISVSTAPAAFLIQKNEWEDVSKRYLWWSKIPACHHCNASNCGLVVWQVIIVKPHTLRVCSTEVFCSDVVQVC